MKIFNFLLSALTAYALTVNISHAAPCSVSDVTAFDLTGTTSYSANACVNKSGNDGDGSTFITEINSEFGTTGSWKQLIKSDSPSSDLLFTSGGIGTWDASAIASQITNPFVIVLKAANAFAAYLFQIDTNGEGTFSTVGVNDKIKDISHISLYSQEITVVPVPAAAWLIAPVFAGFMLRRRKA